MRLAIPGLGLAALLLSACACRHAPTAPSAPLGSPFRLGVGQSVKVESAGFELGFDQVLEEQPLPGGRHLRLARHGAPQGLAARLG